jgi:hypothetical protein
VADFVRKRGGMLGLWLASAGALVPHRFPQIARAPLAVLLGWAPSKLALCRGPPSSLLTSLLWNLFDRGPVLT